MRVYRNQDCTGQPLLFLTPLVNAPRGTAPEALKGLFPKPPKCGALIVGGVNRMNQCSNLAKSVLVLKAAGCLDLLSDEQQQKGWFDKDCDVRDLPDYGGDARADIVEQLINISATDEIPSRARVAELRAALFQLGAKFRADDSKDELASKLHEAIMNHPPSDRDNEAALVVCACGQHAK